MRYLNQTIINCLREARISKGFSQRELSERSGVPQSHISKIESGSVDLRIASLIALGRVLDLELLLIPKKSLPAVQTIVRRESVLQAQQDQIEPLEQIKPAYRLDENEDEDADE